MSNPQNKELQSTATQPKQPMVPDGKSKLPEALLDYPADKPGDSGPTTGPAK